MSTEPNLLSIVKRYLKALEEAKTVDEITTYYADSVEQIEYPNRFMPNGAHRNFQDLQEAFLRGKAVMSSQIYDVQKSYVVGNTVILEILWTAKLAIPIGQLPAGGEMKAYFAQFIEFENDKIVRQRTYDCFEAF